MKVGLTLLLVTVVAAASAVGAAANGDPASDVLPFTTVYLSIKDPKTSAAGRDLLNVTTVAAKKKKPIRVAVISQPSDLGLIQSLWHKPQSYSEFLGKELFQFGHYDGTTLIAMPNGYGIYGPQTAKGKPALAGLAKPGTGDLEQLGSDAADAVRAVAVANGFTLPAKPPADSATAAWAIILGAVGGAVLIAGALFFGLRRWLLSPET